MKDYTVLSPTRDEDEQHDFQEPHTILWTPVQRLPGDLLVTKNGRPTNEQAGYTMP